MTTGPMSRIFSRYFAVGFLLSTSCAHRQQTALVQPTVSAPVGPQRITLAPQTPLVRTPPNVLATRPPLGTIPDWQPPTVQSFVLRNQLTVYVVPQPTEDHISIRYVNRRAGENDISAAPGLAMATLKMLEEGSTVHPGDALRLAYRASALTFSASTLRDAAVMSLEGARETLPTALTLLAETVIRPGFEASGFLQVQRTIAEQLQGQQLLLDSVAEITCARLFFGAEHRLGTPLEGTNESIQARTLQHVTQFYQQRYIPAHSALVLVGPVTVEQVRPLVEAQFGAWRSTQTPIASIATGTLGPNPEVKLHFINDPSSALTYTFIAFRGPPARTPLSLRVQLVQNILAELTYSRLIRALRAEDGDTYAVGSELPSSSLGGLIRLSYAVPAQRTAASLSRVVQEIVTLRNTPPTDEEFERARLRMLSQFVSQFGATAALADATVNMFIDHPLNDQFAQYMRTLRAITAADVSAGVSQFYVPQNILVLFIGNAARSTAGIPEVGLGDMRVYNLPQTRR